MVNGIITIYPPELDKGFGSRFYVGSFDKKHVKKAEGCIVRNVNIAKKMNKIVRILKWWTLSSFI